MKIVIYEEVKLVGTSVLIVTTKTERVGDIEQVIARKKRFLTRKESIPIYRLNPTGLVRPQELEKSSIR